MNPCLALGLKLVENMISCVHNFQIDTAENEISTRTYTQFLQISKESF